MQKVEKGWGYEQWAHNDEKYCGKVLVFQKHKTCSMHYHKLKTETFLVFEGKVLLQYSDDDELKNVKQIILDQGSVFEIPAGLRHQIFALEDSRIIEFSTQHYESDSYRVFLGDSIQKERNLWEENK